LRSDQSGNNDGLLRKLGVDYLTAAMSLEWAQVWKIHGIEVGLYAN